VWLTSFDPGAAWAPTEVQLMRPVTIGSRADHAWAQLAQPINLSGLPVSQIILGARHAGDNVWLLGESSIHVFVCTVSPELANRDAFTRDQIQIDRWAILHPSLSKKEIEAGNLVHEIVGLGGLKRLPDGALSIVEFVFPNIHVASPEMNASLRVLRDELVLEAKERGWDIA
jgi:hypothetical protein